jgi:hypothetical protein
MARREPEKYSLDPEEVKEAGSGTPGSGDLDQRELGIWTAGSEGGGLGLDL